MKSSESERAVAGMAMCEATSLYAQVGHLLSAEDFDDPVCRAIWKIAVKHASQGRDIDPIVVLEENPVLNRDAVFELNVHMATTANADYWAQKVKAESLRRKGLDYHRQSIAELERSETDDVGCLLEGQHATLAALPGVGAGVTTVNGAEAAKSWSAEFRSRFDEKSPVPGIPTGIEEFDVRIKGLFRGHSYCLAAGTGDGKTIAGTFTGANAAKNGYRVLYVTAEVPAEDIIERMICCDSMVNGERLIDGMVTDEDLHRVLASLKRMKPWCKTHLDIMYVPNPSPQDVERQVMATALNPSTPNYDLVIVDYVQLMYLPGKSEKREIELNKIGHGLDAIAKKHDCAVLYLAQLNNEHRQGPKTVMPQKHNIAGSKALANPCSGVFTLWRPRKDGVEVFEYFTDDGKKSIDTAGLAVFNVCKVRKGGREGAVPVKMKPEFQKFEKWVDAQSYPSDFDDIPPF